MDVLKILAVGEDVNIEGTGSGPRGNIEQPKTVNGGANIEGDASPKAFDKNKIFQGVDTSKSTANDADVQKVFNTAFLWAGIICVLIIVIAGFKYTVSVGDASGVAKAKQTLTYAVFGLIIIIFAFAITNFILGVF